MLPLFLLLGLGAFDLMFFMHLVSFQDLVLGFYFILVLLRTTYSLIYSNHVLQKFSGQVSNQVFTKKLVEIIPRHG